MLTLENLSTSDPRLPLINLQASFEPGKIYTILGRTGSGKTELLRMLIGLDPISEGSVRLDGIDLARTPIRARQMAMVYQQFINYPHLNVLGNVAFPLLRRRIGRAKAESLAREALKLVGLADFDTRMPSALSGGQQQRVALARAIAKQARILLMDEPLASLDYKLREQLRGEFPQLLRKNVEGIILYATTDPSEAMQLGDEMIVMHGGRIVAKGRPTDLFDHPPNVNVARVISDPPISICPGRIADGMLFFEDGSPLDMADVKLETEGQVQIGMRPDAFNVGGEIPARVTQAEFSGSDTIVHLQLSFGEATMLVDGIHEYHTGDEFGVALETRNILLFSEDGMNITDRAE